MKITRIEQLHREMIISNESRINFDFSYAEASFNVIFITDNVPFILMFGIVGENDYFEIEMNEEYEVSNMISVETYKLLVKYLDFSYDTDGPFKPVYFFEAFNAQLPNNLTNRNLYQPSVLMKYYNDVEESEKIYFKTWIDHEMNRRRNQNYIGNVTSKNLDKTNRILGEQAYQRCRDNNISSRWSPNRSDERDYRVY